MCVCVWGGVIYSVLFTQFTFDQLCFNNPKWCSFVSYSHFRSVSTAESGRSSLPIYHISTPLFFCCCFFQNFQFSFFSSFLLTWDLMGTIISKRYPSHKSLPFFFSDSCIFVSNILTKLRKFPIFTFLYDFFFSFSLTWDPIGAKISKRYPSHKQLTNVFKLVSNVCLQYPHKVTFSDFRNFDIWILTIF